MKLIFSWKFSHYGLPDKDDRSNRTFTTSTMVAGIERKTGSIEHYKQTSLSKGRRSRGYDLCSPERRYVVRPEICHHSSGSSVYTEYSSREMRNQQCVAGILDTFACLCIGSGVVGNDIRRDKYKSGKVSGRKANGGRRRVVYPIASYPARLNSKKLVDQRRKSVPHQFFRPIPDDEVSLSDRPRTA